MTTNSWFNLYNNQSEQSLVDDLNKEAIQIHGLNFLYIPRQNANLDALFGEDVLSHFTKSYEIEMYIKNVDGMEGDNDMLSKFGLEIRDKISLLMNKSRFLEVTKGSGLIRPNEGDLIYLNLKERPALLEISFVEQETVFHQLGELYNYELKCELYRYSQESIQTTYDAVDNIEETFKNAISLQLTAGGTGVFLKDEIVFQGTSLGTATAQAKVIDFDQTNHILNVISIIGEFLPTSGNIKGNTSSASWVLNLLEERNNINSDIDDNQNIYNESQADINRGEKDPFSGSY